MIAPREVGPGMYVIGDELRVNYRELLGSLGEPVTERSVKAVTEVLEEVAAEYGSDMRLVRGDGKT